ncbi:hypothetical protein [Streptantibioticus parmotrematis]|nr:hypothetical protein [Streptantibioticus parmotrematis]
MSGEAVDRLPGGKEGEVHAMLDAAYPVVPPDLAARAMARGSRRLRRRRLARTALVLLLLAAVVAAAVWAIAVWPSPPPLNVPPPPGGW